jgi:hypothetical protein
VINDRDKLMRGRGASPRRWYGWRTEWPELFPVTMSTFDPATRGIPWTDERINRVLSDPVICHEVVTDIRYRGHPPRHGHRTRPRRPVRCRLTD